MIVDLVSGDRKQPSAETSIPSIAIEVADVGRNSDKYFLHHVGRVVRLKIRSSAPAIDQRGVRSTNRSQASGSSALTRSSRLIEVAGSPESSRESTSCGDWSIKLPPQRSQRTVRPKACWATEYDAPH